MGWSDMKFAIISAVSKQDIKEVKNYRDAFNLVSNYLKTETSIRVHY